jgi:3-hydroxybutyryl-CoA dehydratase
VRIGDTVTATVTVREIDTAKQRIKLETVARVEDTVVIEGEAALKVPSRG